MPEGKESCPFPPSVLSLEHSPKEHPPLVSGIMLEGDQADTEGFRFLSTSYQPSCPLRLPFGTELCMGACRAVQ